MASDVRSADKRDRYSRLGRLTRPIRSPQLDLHPGVLTVAQVDVWHHNSAASLDEDGVFDGNQTTGRTHAGRASITANPGVGCIDALRPVPGQVDRNRAAADMSEEAALIGLAAIRQASRS